MQIEKDYKWGTHIPMIKGILDLYNPAWVLESGIGLHSTPCFIDYKYIGVENDKNWLEFSKEQLPNMDFRHHYIPEIDLATRWQKVPKSTRLNTCLFYLGLDLPKETPGLLFVDGYTGTRRLVINTMRNKVDIIIFHDCQPRSRSVYNYENIETEGFTTYYLTSPTSWTGVMLKNDVGLAALQKAIAPHIKEFLKQWPEAKAMEVIRG